MIRATAIILAALLMAGAAFLPSLAMAAQRVTVVLASGTTTDVVELGTKAVGTVHHAVWPRITDALAVWVDAGPTSPSFGPFTFRRSLDIPAGAAAFTGSVRVTSDNAYQLYVNGALVGGDGPLTVSPSACETTTTEWQSVETFDIAAYLKAGQTNTVDVKAVNYQEKTKPLGCDQAAQWWGRNPAMVEFRAELSYLPLTTVDLTVLDAVEIDGPGLVRVAVLSTTAFDALTLDLNSVCFGSLADAAARDCTVAGWTSGDIDADGDVDWILNFEENQVGFVDGDTTAALTGRTLEGGNVEGTAPVTFRLPEPEPDPVPTLVKAHGKDKGCNLERNADGMSCGNGNAYGQSKDKK